MDSEDWGGVATYLHEKADRVEGRNPDHANTLRDIAEMHSGAQREQTQAYSQQGNGIDTGVLLSEVEPLETAWLWDKRIALGNVTIIWGGPGVGKSTLMCDIAARVTNGWAMPDGSENMAPGGVVLISMEDSQESTIVPRLIAAGADLARIKDLSRVKKNIPILGGTVEQPFSLVSDLSELEAAIASCEATLVILDPIGGVLNGKSIYQNQGIRQVFDPLRVLAERLGIAVVLIGHPKKGNYKTPWDAISGSSAFGEVARTMHFVESVKGSPGTNLLINFKNNLAPLQEPMAYTVNAAQQRIDYIRGLQVPEQKRKEVQHYGDVRTMMQKVIDDNPTMLFTGHMLLHELQRAYGLATNYGLIRKHLSNMRGAGTIQQPRLGYYASLLWKPEPEPERAHETEASRAREASQASQASHGKETGHDTTDSMGPLSGSEHTDSVSDATTRTLTSSERGSIEREALLALQETQRLGGSTYTVSIDADTGETVVLAS